MWSKYFLNSLNFDYPKLHCDESFALQVIFFLCLSPFAQALSLEIVRARNKLQPVCIPVLQKHHWKIPIWEMAGKMGWRFLKEGLKKTKSIRILLLIAQLVNESVNDVLVDII